MIIKENFSLKPFNTFGIEATSRFFVEVNSREALQTLLTNPKWKDIPKMILGEGSNVLFSQDFPGLVIKIAIKGIQKIAEDPHHVWLEIAAGETWHEVVLYSIAHEWAGIENLSLIPGTVGAAPMQNIGAYGVELSNTFDKLVALRMSDLELRVFEHAECQFGYRDSIFKKELKDQYIILSVILKLNKIPNYHIEYGAIKETLIDMQIKELNIQAVSQAVIKIRQQKLPDPKKIGNAGSFFKNPILSQKEFFNLSANHPTIPFYCDAQGQYKIPAAWFIEQCGWKGHRREDCGVHEQHALVLVNYGKSSGLAIKDLAENIQASVKEKFAVLLLPEVNII
jgi:UDP-N-acetylmuramate dehydrogenase